MRSIIKMLLGTVLLTLFACEGNEKDIPANQAPQKVKQFPPTTQQKTAKAATSEETTVKDIYLESDSLKILKLSIENQSKINFGDPQQVSLWSAKVGLLNLAQLIEGINRIKEPQLLQLYRTTLLLQIPWQANHELLFESVKKIVDSHGKKEFLVQYLAAQLNHNLGNILSSLSEIRNISSEFSSARIYNQMVADLMNELKPNQTEPAWSLLSTISDPVARAIAAQKIFDIKYTESPESASKWLNGVPAGQDKNEAITFLVARLKILGDEEAAIAWEKSKFTTETKPK